MSEPAEKYSLGPCEVVIEYDSDTQDPREDYDHIATMVCEHGRYTLGDKTGRRAAQDAVGNSRDAKPSWFDSFEVNGRWYDAKYDTDDPPQLWAAVQACRDIVSMPLYLYDHSGITMSTSPFSCRWDSGQIGFIFMTKKEILERWGRPNDKILSPALKEKARAGMKAEVEEYDQYLTGDVYWAKVTNGDDEESCGGFYGIEAAKEYAEETAKGMGYAPAEEEAANQEAVPA